jgi:hypothetical protein
MRRRFFYNVPDNLLPLASGVTPARKAEAGAVPKVPEAWELSVSVCSTIFCVQKANDAKKNQKSQECSCADPHYMRNNLWDKSFRKEIDSKRINP